jgi:hypothetical protein
MRFTGVIGRKSGVIGRKLHDKLVNFTVRNRFIITPFRASFSPFPADFPIGKCRFPALQPL